MASYWSWLLCPSHTRSIGRCAISDNTILPTSDAGGDTLRTEDHSGGGVKTPVSLIDVGGTGGTEAIIGDSGVAMPVGGLAAENAAVSGNPILFGGRYDATPRTLGDGDVGAVALDADGALHISDGGNTITIDGSVSLTGNLPDTSAGDLAAINAALAGTLTVGSHAVTNAGTFAVQEDGAALTALQLLDDAVYTDGSGTPSKGYAVMGTDGTNPQILSVNTSGHVNIADGGNSISVDGSVSLTGNLPDTSAGDLAAINSAVSGTLTVDGSGVTQPVSGTVTANLSATDNAVLDSIAANTANLQNCIVQDDAPFTPGAGYLMMIGGEYDDAGTDSVNEGDAGNIRISANRCMYVNIRDNAGNERGLNIDANGYLTSNINGTVTVDASGAAVPITDNSGSLTVDAANDGSLTVQIGDGTNAATIRNLASNDALNVAIVDGSGNQVTSFGGSGGTSATDDAAFTAASGSGTPIMGFVSADAVDSGDVGVVAMSTDRRLHVDAQIVGQDADVTIADGGNSITVDNGGTFAVQAAQSGTWNVNNVSGTVSLPTGAATAAKQPALGTAGTASTDVITVQGIASMTPLLVDASGAAVPVTDNGGSLTVDNGGTFAVQVDGTALTRLTDIETNTDFGATTGGGTETGALRVTIANDSTGVVSVDDNGGSLTVDGTVTANLSATDNAVLDVIETNTSGNTSHYRNIDANAEAEIKGSAGTLKWLHAINLTNAIAYLHLYDATAASVTPGTTTPTYTFPVPTTGTASQGSGFVLPAPIEFSNGITLVCTTTLDGSTGDPGTNGVVVNAGYE